jgi:hypothetical protein
MGTALIAVLTIGFVSFAYLVSDLTSSATKQKQKKVAKMPNPVAPKIRLKQRFAR